MIIHFLYRIHVTNGMAVRPKKACNINSEPLVCMYVRDKARQVASILESLDDYSLPVPHPRDQWRGCQTKEGL
jgi:hypothetical protein